MKILVINSGSLTQKISIAQVSEVDNALVANTFWTKVDSVGSELSRASLIPAQLNTLIKEAKVNLEDIDAVGHRIVHGGTSFNETTKIDASVVEKLKAVSNLAPIHNPPALESIEIALELLGKVPHIAVFDTSFHSTIPDYAHLYAVPLKWYQNYGIKRYGFHGISHKNAYEKSKELVDSRSTIKMVTCHLGGGSSLCAIKNGSSIDTTMGFTPLDGLMMSTRPGAMDPGILTYLMEEHHLSLNDLNNCLNNESGIKGISELSGDMKELIEHANRGSKNAELALSMYLLSVKKFIASMGASLEGISALAFTGGVGENSSYIRERVVSGLSFLGAKIDPNLNTKAQNKVISSSDSKIVITVVQCDESAQIAKECFRLLS